MVVSPTAEVLVKIKSDVSVQIRMPKALHNWFKTYAASNNVTMTEVLVGHLLRLKSSDEKRMANLARQI